MSENNGVSENGYEYHTGPVTLRHGQVPPTTTDQRLLDERGPTDWVHTDPWRVLRIQSEFVEGFGALAELGPAVSVFGSARTRPDDAVYAMAENRATSVQPSLAETGTASASTNALAAGRCSPGRAPSAESVTCTSYPSNSSRTWVSASWPVLLGAKR